MSQKFKEIRLGSSTEKYRVISDMGNVPQGLREGDRFVTLNEIRFYDRIFKKGHGLKFFHYVVLEHPSSSDKYDVCLYRAAVFKFDGDSKNRQMSADEIMKV